MEYSIQELSRLSGVTTRALRWYDQIGLLKPSRVAESGYRYYGGAEIRAKYGDQEVDEANAAVMNLTREQYQEWTDLGREIQERLEAAVQAGLSPESEAGKELCALHRRWLTITGNRYDPAKHRGIAELYVMDERFTAYYDKHMPGCARFLRDAVVHWVK